MKQKWIVKRIEDICEKASSNIAQNKLEGITGDYPVFGASGFVQNADFYHRDSEYIGIVKDGSGVGRVNLYPAYSSLLGTMQYVLPKNGNDIRYIAYALKSLNLASFASGAAIPHIYFKDYGKCELPVPPKDEQERIVAELDLLTGVIEKKKAQLQEYDKLVQSIFYDMFGDPIENPKNWPIKRLGDVCSKLTDGTHNSPVNTPQGDYPYVTAKNIRKTGLDLSDLTYVSEEIHKEIYSRCNPEYGDVLYIKDGITTGIAQVNTLTFEFSLLSSVALLKLKKDIANPYFISVFLNNDSVYKKARSSMGGAAITRLTLAKLKVFNVIVPPLALQQSFADKIASIEKQKAAITQSIAETQKLLDYTMDKYFG
ncbi:type I restriction enzyme, S subunit [Fibrobacter sp. UWH9]|uniref:restriction endonuclease subunit S n=1 Tax=Fibrobacter sp. UWH9 TaxID=1896213 RepID=UPI00091780D9|nr:restriction endonuclease subunit S [Fibrobacter sp. UWH9]SHH43225.1 type I restriction enzyme, S subunit [Fibrobacter sp. UWH9]